jgi:ATP-dependent Clp protease adaptor protein ClpS
MKNTSTELLEEVEINEDIKETNQLVVFNDDYNTFEHVIEVLVAVCEHTFEQAEQCTLIIHNKGKCSVKEGEFDKLNALKRQINEYGIDAKVL